MLDKPYWALITARVKSESTPPRPKRYKGDLLLQVNVEEVPPTSYLRQLVNKSVARHESNPLFKDLKFEIYHLTEEEVVKVGGLLNGCETQLVDWQKADDLVSTKMLRKIS